MIDCLQNFTENGNYEKITSESKYQPNQLFIVLRLITNVKSKMKIRLAKQKDISVLMDITCRCILNLNANGIDQWDDTYPSKEDFLNNIQEETLYVIDSSNVIRGCICINELEHPGYENAAWAGSNFHVIHKIIIDPLFENKGHGTFSMLFAEKISHEKTKDSIRLDCYKKNLRANNFYRSLGYIVKGEATFRDRPFYLYEKLI